MPAPFPGMDPYLEVNPVFHELHTQMLAEAQAQLQPQLRPKYVARLERHLSEGSVWDANGVGLMLEGKEPDITIISHGSEAVFAGPPATLARPTACTAVELEADELEMRKQRRIVIYVQARPRLAVTSIELLSPSNKEKGSVGQARYLEKRSSALHGGLHWVEIDLLRGGERPPMPLRVPRSADYLAYVAQATLGGWNHLLYAWPLFEPLPCLPIPLLGDDQVALDLGGCFRQAYERIAADEEANYESAPPPPPMRPSALAKCKKLLRQKGFRK